MIRSLFYTIIISFTLLLFSRCIGKEKIVFEDKIIDGENVLIKKRIDRKGNIFSEELLNKDSIRNGYYKEFHLGKLKDSGNYNLGKKEGLWSYWNLNGDVIKTENWFLGKQFGEQIEYYRRRKSDEMLCMYKYCFYNLDGQKIFESKFDREMRLLSTEGTPFYCAYNRNNINLGDSFELVCFLGLPRKSEWSFSIKETEESSQSSLIQKEINSNDSDAELLNLSFARKYIYMKKYLVKGNYTLSLFLNIKSLTGQIIFTGSTKIDVSVQ